MFNAQEQQTYADAIRRFIHVRPDYVLLGEYLKRRLGQIAQELGVYPIIMGRAKSIESFAEKIRRKGPNYADPLKDMTDLCGVRVITHTTGEVDMLAARVRKEFAVDEKNSDDKKEKLAYVEFGYLSKHLIIQLKGESGAGDPILRECLEAAGARPMDQAIERFITMKAELQLRTLAQHAWADIYHELGYKNEFQLPGRWEREFARLAALLEDCDKGFEEIKHAMRSFESSYGAYMSAEQIMDLAQGLELLLDCCRDQNVPAPGGARHRLIRAYLALENHKELKTLLDRHSIDLDHVKSAAVLRDIGVAYCLSNPPVSAEFARGQELLLRAVESDKADIDALCSLAGTYRQEAKSIHALAFSKGDEPGPDSSETVEPRATQEAGPGSSPAARCATSNETGTDSTAALELAKRKQARDLYRQAHRIDPSDPYALGNYIAEELLIKGDVEIVQYFHPLIQAAADRCLRQVEARVNLPWALFDLGIFHLYLENPDSSVAYYAKGIENATKPWMIGSARKPIEEFRMLGLDLQDLDMIDALLDLGFRAKSRDTGGEPGKPVSSAPAGFKPPVLILAGGCGGLESDHRSDLGTLKAVLQGFGGTIVSGGTKSGIAEIAGGLQQSAAPGTLETIGYLPSEGTPGLAEQIDSRYNSLRHTTGSGFSPREPLFFWDQLLASGADPRSVKLIGFNGGRIAACEFRIALALGAQVGMIQKSGRAADDLLADALWKECQPGPAAGPRAHPVSLYSLDLSSNLKDFLAS